MGMRHEVDVARLRRSAPKPYEPKTPLEQDTYALRKTFMGEELPAKAYSTGIRLAGVAFQHVGTNESVGYVSNKWKGGKTFEEFKHVAESKQKLYAAKGAIAGTALAGPWWRPSDDVIVPSAVAELAPCIFLEARLFVDEDKHGDGVLGRGDDGCVRIHPSGCLLYAGYLGDKTDPRYGEPFLLVGSKTQGAQFLVLGTGLDVTKDGIVG